MSRKCWNRARSKFPIDEESIISTLTIVRDIAKYYITFRRARNTRFDPRMRVSEKILLARSRCEIAVCSPPTVCSFFFF